MTSLNGRTRLIIDAQGCEELHRTRSALVRQKAKQKAVAAREQVGDIVPDRP
jgi:hypothetical protein